MAMQIDESASGGRARPVVDWHAGVAPRVAVRRAGVRLRVDGERVASGSHGARVCPFPSGGARAGATGRGRETGAWPSTEWSRAWPVGWAGVAIPLHLGSRPQARWRGRSTVKPSREVHVAYFQTCVAWCNTNPSIRDKLMNHSAANVGSLDAFGTLKDDAIPLITLYDPTLHLLSAPNRKHRLWRELVVYCPEGAAFVIAGSIDGENLHSLCCVPSTARRKIHGRAGQPCCRQIGLQRQNLVGSSFGGCDESWCTQVAEGLREGWPGVADVRQVSTDHNVRIEQRVWNSPAPSKFGRGEGGALAAVEVAACVRSGKRERLRIIVGSHNRRRAQLGRGDGSDCRGDGPSPTRSHACHASSRVPGAPLRLLVRYHHSTLPILWTDFHQRSCHAQSSVAARAVAACRHATQHGARASCTHQARGRHLSRVANPSCSHHSIAAQVANALSCRRHQARTG